uniref:Galectin n=1 Tax=Salvator merianae TaxID=96440 RepID=A0A8D0CDI4_SALMN
MESKLVFSHLTIKPGECIKLKGQVAPEAKSFALNLGRDESDLILHFNPRFEIHGDTKIIVCNSKACGVWGEELREPVFPFQQGEETKICVVFNDDEVTVKVNGDQEIKFPNRQGLDTARYLAVNGDIKIKSIKFD